MSHWTRSAMVPSCARPVSAWANLRDSEAADGQTGQRDSSNGSESSRRTVRVVEALNTGDKVLVGVLGVPVHADDVDRVDVVREVLLVRSEVLNVGRVPHLDRGADLLDGGGDGSPAGLEVVYASLVGAVLLVPVDP